MKSHVLILLLFCMNIDLYAQQDDDHQDSSFPISQSTYGGIGLIQNPTARFSKDGELLFGISSESPYNRVFAKMQFFPWLEGVVRYTEATYSSYNWGSPQTWKDKGFDIRVKLFDEKENMPALAIGFNDFGGTGFYASEYIVASKIINNVDFSLGIGWGRFANSGEDWLCQRYDPTLCKSKRGDISNPLGWFIDSSNTRGGNAALGGNLNLSSFFSGPEASFFGGFEYYTPIDNLSLKVEYDSHDYREVIGREYVFYEEGNVFKVQSSINAALNYRLKPSERERLDLSLGLSRGNTIYANFAVHSNLNLPGKDKYKAPPEIINTPYLESFSTLNADWKKYLTELIFWQMGNEGLVPHQLIFNQNEMIVEVSQGRFRKPIQAIDLAGRILANNSPKNIDKITVITIDSGIETLRSSVSRKDLVESVSNGSISTEIMTFNKYAENFPNAITVENNYLYPNFSWSLRPHMNGTLQHQIQFYFYQLEALLTADYTFKKGLYLSSVIGVDIANNFDKYVYHKPDGELYHVRQDRRLYLTQGTTGLRKLAMDYVFSPTKNIKGRLSGGLLEWMYGGIGGELLYMPSHRMWGVGVDAWWVKQRDFDQKFSFKDYETVTGFLTLYYDIPFYDMRLKASAGRFLAKDKGLLIDISRRFKSGAKVGAKVALTDCDAGCVGEGSFNKWIYFDLPMDLFYVNSTTRSTAAFEWSPLTKDAGQKVATGTIYNVMTNAQDNVDSLRRKNWSFKNIISGFSTSPKDSS